LTVTLGALCFSAIAHLLMVALGTVGSSLLLVTLLLQLSASGGTYPGNLLPPYFDAIGPFLPLTYLINAYRVAITGGPIGHYLRDVVIFALVLVAALGLLVVVVRRRGQFALLDLHPPTAAS
jgi:putative membrane protein